MRLSSIRRAPVVTFLSKNPGTDKKLQKILCSLFSFEELHHSSAISSSKNSVDSLEKKLSFASLSKFSLGEIGWRSTAVRCQMSGSVIHFLSYGSDNNIEESQGLDSFHPMPLISLTDTEEENYGTDKKNLELACQAIQTSRDFVSENLSRIAPLYVSISNMIGRSISSNDVLGKRSKCIPLLKLNNVRDQNPHDEISDISQSKKRINNRMRLREIVIPYFDDNMDSNMIQSSLFSRLQNNSEIFKRPLNPKTKKPIFGLYEWPLSPSAMNANASVYLRPLPAASEDHSLPPVTLVFQCDDLAEFEEQVVGPLGLMVSKVGFTGACRKNTNDTGQLMIHLPGGAGLDIRVCASKSLSSVFAEAQDALLAGSVEELQNVNVLAEGGVSVESNSMKNYGNQSGLGDCWVEFRANMKRPSGFFGRPFESYSNVIVPKKQRGNKSRIAKAPDLPFE